MARHGIAKAYPITIRNWREVVNDHFGAEPGAQGPGVIAIDHWIASR